LLLRIPAVLAISGEKLPRTWKNDRLASPWLRCLACLYLAQKDDDDDDDEEQQWKPYIQSLPTSYETLWRWKDDEVRYLSSTALGETLQADRQEGTLERRMNDYVLPYMKHLKIPTGKDPIRTFQQLSMCLSTRGFHMQQPPNNNNNNNDSNNNNHANVESKSTTTSTPYLGPFLLPVIDLLNHSADEKLKATTLQRDSATGDFCMVAERDVNKGEEILHSYGDLTASQLLQTFGFVPESTLRRVLSPTDDAAAAATAAVGPNTTATVTTTPAMLSKEVLVAACETVKKSSYPKELKITMEENDLEGEVFELDDARQRKLDFLPDQFLVTPSTETGSYLSDEMVTLCCTQMLPNEMYSEVFADEPKQLLGQEVLEDYFLGKLVAMAILTAIKTKMETYQPLTKVCSDIVEVEATEDKAILEAMLSLEHRDLSTYRALYGIAVRLEEKHSLEELRNEVLAIIAALDNDDGEEEENVEGDLKTRPSKKVKSSE